MRETYKKIISISLLILGLVIVVHSYLPHDHHYDYSSDIIYHHNSNTNNTPVHCHFFNNIDLDKIAISGLKQTLKKISYFFSFSFSNLLKTETSFRKITTCSIKGKFLDDFLLLSVSPTRGSPLS